MIAEFGAGSPVSATAAEIFKPLLASPLRPLKLDLGGQKSVGPKARLCGALLKQRKGSENHWQMRHFEISSGKLKWWLTLTEQQNGRPHKNELDLQGLRMQKKSESKFELQTQSTIQKGRVYVLDVDARSSGTDDSVTVHSLRTWIEALEQEAVLARRASQVTLGGTGDVSPDTSPRRLGSYRRSRLSGTASASPSSVASSSLSAFSSPPRRVASRASNASASPSPSCPSCSSPANDFPGLPVGGTSFHSVLGH